MSDLEIFDGDSYRGVSRKKLLALVRKCLGQRDEAFTELANALEGAGPSKSDIAKANAALDEIVRGG